MGQQAAPRGEEGFVRAALVRRMGPPRQGFWEKPSQSSSRPAALIPRAAFLRELGLTSGCQWGASRQDHCGFIPGERVREIFNYVILTYTHTQKKT